MKKACEVVVCADIVDDCATYIADHEIQALSGIVFSDLFERFSLRMREFTNRAEYSKILSEDGILRYTISFRKEIEARVRMATACALFALVNNSIFTPLIDRKNKTPFTVYKSSTRDIGKLKSSGVRFYSPTDKLGFHNDLYFRDDYYVVPKFISLCNLFIGYANPGSFYYVNKKDVEDFSKLVDEGLQLKFKFRPTPILYGSESETVAGTERWVSVPLVWRDANGSEFASCSGDIVGNSDEFVEKFKNSILHCDKRFYLTQDLFSVVVMRNDLGFHARDIFEKQLVVDGVTRLMARAVSSEGIPIPSL